MKKCCKCKSERPLDRFAKNKSTKDGLAFECKICTKAFQDAHRAANGDAIRAADNARFGTAARQATITKYRNSEKGRQAIYRAHQAWRSRYPEHYQATNDVNNAIQAGRLFKQPCFVCGARKVEGHHPDYSRPLDVVWLCTAHHKEVHLMVRP